MAAGGIGQDGNIDHLGAGARVPVFDWDKGGTLAEIESSAAKGIVQRLALHPQSKWLFAYGGDNAGFAILIEPATRKIACEGESSFQFHDFVVSDAADRVIVAGHNGLAVTSIAMG